MKVKLEMRSNEAAQTQVRYYDRKHLPRTYIVGDKIHFNMKHIQPSQPFKRLILKYFAPVDVEMPVSKQVYFLKLPAGFRAVQNTSAGLTTVITAPFNQAYAVND